MHTISLLYFKYKDTRKFLKSEKQKVKNKKCANGIICPCAIGAKRQKLVTRNCPKGEVTCN
jgi:hypothetical protein